MTTLTQTLHPSPSCTDLLMNLVVALLAPMFLGVTAGDVALARMAAHETVTAYRTESQADLIAVAQIIGFGLAALGSLSLSMAHDMSLSMTLRLRSNATALHRSAEQNRKALGRIKHNDPVPSQPASPTPPNPEPFLSPIAEQALAIEAQARLTTPEPATEPAAKLAPQREQEMWAIALVSEASEISVSLPDLPPDQQQPAILKAAQLSSAAHTLLYGPAMTPLQLINLLTAAQQDPEPHFPASDSRPGFG